MSAAVRAAIVGVGETAYRTHHPDATYPELAQAAGLEALAMAGMTPADVDAVVYSMAPTHFMGVTDAQLWATVVRCSVLGAVTRLTRSPVARPVARRWPPTARSRAPSRSPRRAGQQSPPQGSHPGRRRAPPPPV